MSPAMTETASPVLEVQNLVTEFPLRTGAFRAVDDVSFALESGKTLCVVGESGSGKSVTARSILQIVGHPGRIAGGRILLHRRRGGGSGRNGDSTLDLAGLDPKSKAMRAIRGGDIAMIFQEPMSSLSPVHTIGDQIAEMIRLHDKAGKREARTRAVEALRQVEIPNPERAVDRYTFEYSGGMRQRAMIAMALSCNPSVLIADEPTTALDVTTQAEILDLIKRLQRENGMAVLFITHDMGVVAEIADDICVMRHGRMVERGGAFEIFEKPRESYTRMLLDAVRALDSPSERRRAMRAAKAPGEAVIRLEGLEKTFTTTSGSFLRRRRDEIHAVAGVDLHLRAGENLGIVGESGSGKTTLGRCLLRVLEASGGRLLYRRRDGEEVDLEDLGGGALRAIRREIRMVFQDPFASLNPRMTVEQIVGEPIFVNGLMRGAALKRRVGELLEMVGLPQVAMERYPHAFSGGQRQRIAIARAIALDPRVIVADEPTSALDVSLRTQVLDLLLDLQERLDLSFIFISHDIGVIRYFCDRIAVMYKGRIVETGETEKVCTEPEHAYTRSLLSAVPRPDPRLRDQKQRHRYEGD